MSLIAATTTSLLFFVLVSIFPISQAKDLIDMSKVHKDANPSVSHVVHVVADGLRPDATVAYPNFNWLKANGVGTDNARNQLESAQTLPNHISMFSGLSVAEHGHYLDGESKDKLEHVNIFDLVKAAGGSTAFYGAKEKFETFEKNWNIDHYLFTKFGNRVISNWMDDMAKTPYTYSFVHFRETDRAGHLSTGGNTTDYLLAVEQMDEYLGQMFQFIEEEPLLNGNTAVVLTSDHGFEDVGNHNDLDDPYNYKIPFYVWGPNVLHGADIYALNGLKDPGDSRITPSCIHNSYSGVLAASLLGIKYDDGPFSNQYLSVSAASNVATASDVKTYAELTTGTSLGPPSLEGSEDSIIVNNYLLKPDSCVYCPNEVTEIMAENGRTCESWRLTVDKCRAPSRQWARSQICKRSCFLAGHPYDSDICCRSSSMAIDSETNNSTVLVGNETATVEVEANNTGVAANGTEST